MSEAERFQPRYDPISTYAIPETRCVYLLQACQYQRSETITIPIDRLEEIIADLRGCAALIDQNKP